MVAEQTKEQALAEYETLHKAWWAAYKRYGAASDHEAVAEQELRQYRAMLLAKFGTPDPKHPDCPDCLAASVFGGPPHDGSAMCRKRKNHCSCNLCH